MPTAAPRVLVADDADHIRAGLAVRPAGLVARVRELTIEAGG